MRIISKFKDYYDGAGAGDLDPVPVYERHTTEVTEKNFLKKDNHDYGGTRISLSNDYTKSNIENRVRTGIIGFCGTVYPYVLKERYNVNHEKMGFNFEYNPDKFKDMLYPASDKWGYQRQRKIYLIGWLENVKKLDFIFKKYNVSSFNMISKGIEPDWQIELNPRLADHCFYKVKDVYTAYQDIRVYLGNDLAKDTEVEVPVGGDKIVAHSKGFNKWSFRKEPGQKKRKRKKDA